MPFQYALAFRKHLCYERREWENNASVMNLSSISQAFKHTRMIDDDTNNLGKHIWLPLRGISVRRRSNSSFTQKKKNKNWEKTRPKTKHTQIGHVQLKKFQFNVFHLYLRIANYIGNKTQFYSQRTVEERTLWTLFLFELTSFGSIFMSIALSLPSYT